MNTWRSESAKNCVQSSFFTDRLIRGEGPTTALASQKEEVHTQERNRDLPMEPDVPGFDSRDDMDMTSVAAVVAATLPRPRTAAQTKLLSGSGLT